MSRILDKAFRYVPAAKTDIRRTFARVRAEQKVRADREAADAAEAKSKTIILPRSRVA